MPYQITSTQTLSTIVKQMATLLSLPQPAAPAGSTDPAVQLMVTCVNLASQEMLATYEWTDLTKRAEIQVVTYDLPSTTAVELPFDLPEDFFRFIDQTQWNGAMQFPAAGPISPQIWQAYMVFPVTSNYTLTWMVRGGQIWFLNPPITPGQPFKFMYLSNAVVIDADDPTLYKNVANKDGDTFVLDGLLLTLIARVKWLEAKGFDSTAASNDVTIAWDSRVDVKRGAAVLNMAGVGSGYPYVGIQNLPVASLYGMPR